MSGWMSDEHEKGSHGNGGGEGYLKYLDGSLRDEAKSRKAHPQDDVCRYRRGRDPRAWHRDGVSRPLQMPAREMECPGLPAASRTVVVAARPGQARPGPGESD